MHADDMRLDDLTGAVIGCAFTVLNALGAGLLEKVYENALAVELRAQGLRVAARRDGFVSRSDRRRILYGLVD